MMQNQLDQTDYLANKCSRLTEFTINLLLRDETESFLNCKLNELTKPNGVLKEVFEICKKLQISQDRLITEICNKYEDLGGNQ